MSKTRVPKAAPTVLSAACAAWTAQWDAECGARPGPWHAPQTGLRGPVRCPRASMTALPRRGPGPVGDFGRCAGHCAGTRRYTTFEVVTQTSKPRTK